MATHLESVETETTQSSFWNSGLGFAAIIAGLRLLLYLWIAPRYGYFRDELYYIDCGKHPAWGYVDQPPMIAWMAWLVEHTIGTSLHALRLLPALAGAGTIFFTGWLAKEFGGCKRSVLLASLAAFFTPIYLAMSHWFSMNAFDALFWMAAATVVIRVAKSGNEKNWVWFGTLVGIALLNKYGVAFFTIGLVTGVLLTSMRRALLSKWLWIGAAIGALIALPNFLWQWNRQFPFLQLMHAVRASGRDTWAGIPWFLGQQAQIIHPLNVVLVVGALIFWFGPMGKRFRALGWAFVITFLILMAMHAKNYYLGPMYPMVLAAGAVWLCSLMPRWIVPAFTTILIFTGVLLSPLALPVLTVQQYLDYTQDRWIGSSEIREQSSRHAAATLCRHVWLGTNGAESSGILQLITGQRARSYWHLRQRLWRGRCDRFLRTALWAATRNQRSPELLVLGTAWLYRREPDRARRQRRDLKT